MKLDIPTPNPKEIDHLKELLETDGFFLEGDISLNLGVAATHSMIKDALRAADWQGGFLNFVQTENGGEWTCYAHDVDMLSCTDAERVALSRWHREQKA